MLSWSVLKIASKSEYVHFVGWKEWQRQKERRGNKKTRQKRIAYEHLMRHNCCRRPDSRNQIHFVAMGWENRRPTTNLIVAVVSIKCVALQLGHFLPSFDQTKRLGVYICDPIRERENDFYDVAIVCKRIVIVVRCVCEQLWFFLLKNGVRCASTIYNPFRLISLGQTKSRHFTYILDAKVR